MIAEACPLVCAESGCLLVYQHKTLSTMTDIVLLVSDKHARSLAELANLDLHEKAADCYHWDGRYVEAELFANSDLHEKAADCYHWDGRYIEAAILEQTPQGNGQCLTCKRYTCKKCSGIGKKQLFVNSDLHEKAADCYHWDGRYIEAAIIEHTSQGNGHCLVSDIHATSGG